MGWKQDLDRYLTTEPDNGFNSYSEKVVDNYNAAFFAHIEMSAWLGSDEESKWIEECFYKEIAPEIAAKKIQARYYSPWQKNM